MSHQHHFSLCQFSNNNVLPSHAPPTMLTLSNDNMSHQHHFSFSQSSGSGDVQSQTIDHAHPEQ
ncbi:hypothetical protein ACK1CN_21915 [Vibrio coralliilyticus]|uniref:hypothetical protein n=1 Tax=Vibrio coralliilyticus TaxID=190893 RepID=UPI003916E0EB